ncbi:Cysteine proteinase inhibitor 5 [Spatholobus suberectus]|nr:Cysteine proteinase inhibitor 5 [Spatholobus suberectus]
MKLVCLLLAFILFASTIAKNEVSFGGWSPIDINDPHVTEIANYAVTEYDKRYGEMLKFEKVIKADTQIVTGINYRVTLTASNGSSYNNYIAIVWEKVWMHFRNLTSFTSAHA